MKDPWTYLAKTEEGNQPLTHYQTSKFWTAQNWNKLQTTFQSTIKMKNKWHIGKKTL